MSETAAIWAGIIFCISQSAMFSGLNLAVFGIGRLRLEVETASGDRNAKKVLRLREDSNLTLTTILWGNVGINVLLTLLSGSVLAGVGAFFFSTVVITCIGEILPQAYFSRNALKMASLLSPVLRFYRLILYPAVKPTAMALDLWLGPEGLQYFEEKDLRELIRRHIGVEGSEIDKIEGMGAINFLAMDDLLVSEEGEPINPNSILKLPVEEGRVVFPPFEAEADDPFLRRIEASGEKWVIVVDGDGDPVLVIDTDQFVRTAVFRPSQFSPYRHCHRPILITDVRIHLGKAISRWRVRTEGPEDDVIDNDIILIWGPRKRIITGADILGRLLRGIANRTEAFV